MPSNTRNYTYTITKGKDTDTHTKELNKINATTDDTEKLEFLWDVIIFIVYAHLSALYGIYLMFTSAKYATLIFGCFIHCFTALALTAGAHRLWSHRSYKAKLPLRLFFLFWFTVTFQRSVIEWVRNHRIHHKFSDTDADPHNINRGLFFSQIGWVLVRKHPQVQMKEKQIDLSDLYNDPMLRIQDKYYVIWASICCFVLPTIIPWYFWNESLSNGWFICVMLRFCLGVNIAGLVNSVAHKWGQKPYDENINPADHGIVSYLTFGESFHNFHHTFPWDYRAPEFGRYSLNLTTTFIDCCAKLGLVYDLKITSDETIRKRILRTGNDKFKQATLSGTL